MRSNTLIPIAVSALITTATSTFIPSQWRDKQDFADAKIAVTNATNAGAPNATARDNRHDKRQAVAVILCNDVIGPDWISDGTCQSFTTATGACINQLEAYNSGSWLDNPKALINDAPNQHCVFFE